MQDDTPTRLKQARKARGWALKDLAREADVHLQTVWTHESGTRAVGQHTLRKYAEALAVPEEWLRYGTGPGPLGEGSEIVEEYLTSVLGKGTSPAVRRILRTVSYTSLGVRKISVPIVHRVRELIETNRLLEGTGGHANQRGKS